jgi:hypothetical protein
MTMFRLQSCTYARRDEDTELLYVSNRTLYFIEVPVVKVTPKGFWLDYYGSRKFVRAEARKRWAYPTKQEALESFIARREKQLKILRSQISESTLFLGMALAKRNDVEDLECQRIQAAPTQLEPRAHAPEVRG